MTDTPHTVEALLEAAINEAFGPRCTDFNANCQGCKTWKAFDDLRSRAALASAGEEKPREKVMGERFDLLATPAPHEGDIEQRLVNGDGPPDYHNIPGLIGWLRGNWKLREEAAALIASLKAQAKEDRISIVMLSQYREQDKVEIADLYAEKQKLAEALERIALLDEVDGYELTVRHAFEAVAIATNTLGKHPSEIFFERRARAASKEG